MTTFLLALAAFLVGTLLFTVIYLRRFRHVTSVAEEPHRCSDVVLGVVWVTAMAAGLYERIMLVWFPFGGWSLALGIMFIVAGISIRLICRRWLSQFYLPQLKIRPDHRLVTTGPYRIVRHPMYTGQLLLDIGLALALGSILALILILIAIPPALAYRIRIEETLLAAQFGDIWWAYVEKTPYRLLPFVF